MQYFFCYSPLLMHYLKACNISFIDEGINNNSKSVFYRFERTKKLDKALSGWEEFKAKQMKELENA